MKHSSIGIIHANPAEYEIEALMDFGVEQCGQNRSDGIDFYFYLPRYEI